MPPRTKPLPFWGGERCYACDAEPVGFRDRRPEGKDLDIACKRHADPTIKVVVVCMYCHGPLRNGTVRIDGQFGHMKCLEADVNGTLDPPIPKGF